MKKFFSLIAAVLFAGSMMAEGLLFEHTYPGNPSTFTNNYTSTFTISTNGDTVTYANFNNGQNASSNWDAIRCGRKSDTSVATISTAAIAETVSKVIVNFTQINVEKTNSLKLLVADNATFSNPTEIVQTITVGEVTFEVANPATNLFYQISIDMAADGSANGFNRIDKIQFISPDGGTPIVPTEYDTLTVAEARAICDTLADGASSADKYYVEGYAVHVQDYSLQYKNQIFFMVDDFNAPDSLFEAYGAVGMKDNQPYPVLEGDKVRAFGKLKKYGTQLEIVNPSLEFLVEVPGDRTIPGVVGLDTVTVNEAIEIAKALTPEKGKSKTTSKTYAVKGFIVGTSSKYQNTWYMADEAGAYGEFQAFKCATIDREVAEGDYVIVTGKIQHYYGEGSEGDYHTYEISGGALQHVYGEGIENIVLTEKAQKVMVDGVLYIVRDNKLYDVRGTQVR